MRSKSISDFDKENMIKPLKVVFSGIFFSTVVGIAGCGEGSSSSAVDQTRTLSNLKSVNATLFKYASAHDEILPLAKNAAELKPFLLPYLTDSSVLEDPVTHVSFMWNAAFSGKSAAALGDYSSMDFPGDIARVVPFYTANPVDINARPIVTVGGKAKLVTDAEWKLIKIACQIP